MVTDVIHVVSPLRCVCFQFGFISQSAISQPGPVISEICGKQTKTSSAAQHTWSSLLSVATASAEIKEGMKLCPPTCKPCFWLARRGNSRSLPPSSSGAGKLVGGQIYRGRSATWISLDPVIEHTHHKCLSTRTTTRRTDPQLCN